MADGALAAWPVFQSTRRWLGKPAFAATAGRLLAYPRVLGVVGLRALAAGAALSGWRPLLAPACGIVAVTSLLLVLRSRFGTDGADELLFLIFVAAAIAYGVGDPGAREVVLWFLAGQACLAYLTAGVAKAISPAWRAGRALPGIFGTTAYGHPRAGTLLGRHCLLARAGGWSVIVLETSFPLVLLGVPPLTYALLLGTTTFHLGAAWLMRLNTFLWAFVATYPAVLACVLR